MTTHARIKLAVVTGVPAPYREPMFALLARQPGIDLRVFYASHGHSDVGWSAGAGDSADFERVFVPNRTPVRMQRWSVVGYGNVGLPSELRAFRPDYLIVYGYNQLFHWLAYRYALRTKTPFAIRSDSNIHLDGGGSWKRRMRRGVVRKLVQRAHALLAVGSANRDFWRGQGAAEEQIYIAPYAVDNDKIIQLGSCERPLSEPVRLIYAGRLIARKGVDRLLRAFASLCRERDAHLTIVGDGPERSRLEEMVPADLRTHVTWTGKLSNERAIAEMKRSDLFVLPSFVEPWGLVVNEAMAAGLSVIAHQHAGAAIDMIEPGVTGWTIDEVTPDNLLQILRTATRDRGRLREMGRQAQERVRAWSFEATVVGILSAVQAGVRTPRPVSRRLAHV